MTTRNLSSDLPISTMAAMSADDTQTVRPGVANRAPLYPGAYAIEPRTHWMTAELLAAMKARMIEGEWGDVDAIADACAECECPDSVADTMVYRLNICTGDVGSDEAWWLISEWAATDFALPVPF